MSSSTGTPRHDDSGPWPEVSVVVGPTASGKSAVGLALARLLGAEIVNADAYQVYRGMDIGTAKPTAAERAGVPHHLLDFLDVTQELSAAHFQRLGRDVLSDLARRNVPAVVVGGSGLYIRALLDDLQFPGSDPEIRAQWERELAEGGPQRLHAVLARRDPQAAAHILPTNGRRIVRALEVGELTGTGFTAQLPVDGPLMVPHASFGLTWERAVLDDRIERRVRQMIDDGLVDEVRGLLQLGLRDGRTASRALGYQQVIDVIDGVIDLPAAIESTTAATRAFARRQQRWFRRDPRTTWLDGAGDPLSTASQIAARLSGSASRLAT